jgi:DNA-binding transcriptional LysR family regulator
LKAEVDHVSVDSMSTPPLSPSLLQLLWFVRIVEAGSFVEAARRAGATTSAMSKAVTRFEQKHGVRLLHRSTHSLSPTDEGDRLFSQGRYLLDSLEQVETSLAELGSQGAAGRVRITAPTAFARSCIMPELPTFLRAHPEINIEIQLGDEMADLATRGIDLAVRSGNLDGLPGHVSRKLYTFPWIACATPEYLKLHGAPETPADLTGHEQIGFRNKETGQIDNWRFMSPVDGKAVRYAPRSKYVFDDGAAAWSIVRAGFGIGWAPAWLGVDDLRNGNVVEVLRDWRIAEAPLSAVRLERRLIPARTQAVLDFLASLPSAWQI